MSNYQSVIDFADTLGIKCWTTHIYIKITGDPALGVFLERIVWWSDKTKRDDGFFYKKAEEWNEELCLSYSQTKLAEEKLTKMGFIQTKKKRANNAPTMHYCPVMETILNSIESKFKKVEIQESRNSENPNLDFQESSISEIQESRKSITGKTQERQQEKEPARDFLGDVVNLQGQVSEGTAPDPDDQWFEYRDKALKAYPGDWGKTVGEKEIKRNLILGFVANTPDFKPDHWSFVIQDCIAHGVSSNNIARFIEVYPFKNYEAYLASKYPKDTNGRDSPQTVIPKSIIKAVPIATGK